MAVQTQVQMRRDTAANWTSTNPTLASGEWGLETDTRLMKIGDGTTAWNSLSYQLGPLLDEVIPTDPTGAYFTGSGFNLYGLTGNGVTAPDSSALDITGDIDIRVKVALNDYTPGAFQALVGKWNTTANQRSYLFGVNTTGTLQFNASSGGTTSDYQAVSSIATGLTDGSTKWLRVTRVASTGSTIFYTSDDGSSWTQLGNTVTTTTGNIFNSTSVLAMGIQSDLITSPANGTFYRAQVLSGIAGTTAFDANFESVAADSFAFTESSANAATVTLTTTRYSFGLPGNTLTGTTTNALTGSNNRTFYSPITVRSKPITIKQAAFEVTGVPASTSTVRMGLYAADAQMQPTGAPLWNSGAVSVSTAAPAIYRVRTTPFVLLPGNYLIAFNFSVAFTARVFLGSGAVAVNTMGANLGVFFSAAQTMSGNYTNPGTKWDARGTNNSALRHFVVLGWS